MRSVWFWPSVLVRMMMVMKSSRTDVALSSMLNSIECEWTERSWFKATRASPVPPSSPGLPGLISNHTKENTFTDGLWNLFYSRWNIPLGTSFRWMCVTLMSLGVCWFMLFVRVRCVSLGVFSNCIGCSSLSVLLSDIVTGAEFHP